MAAPGFNKRGVASGELELKAVDETDREVKERRPFPRSHAPHLATTAGQRTTVPRARRGVTGGMGPSSRAC